MATTNAPLETRWRSRVALAVLLSLFVVASGYGLWSLWNRPPQMGASDEVFRTVDALYTAVRNHDARRLADCERRLHGCRSAGELPPAAADALDTIITQARAGAWDSAAARLYDFMRAQRREGAEAEPHREQKTKAKGRRK